MNLPIGRERVLDQWHNRSMSVFRYSAPIAKDFPGIRGGVALVTDMENRPTPQALIDIYQTEQQQVREAIGETPLSEIPSLAAWRRTFSSFGVKPTQYRNAAEALLRRLTKRGDIPVINAAVDIANVVSIRYRLPVAVFDQTPVSGETTVRYAEGSERFTDLGATAAVHPDPGEVVFVDDAELVSARRWCWRQSDQSATRLETTTALYTIEGQHVSADQDVAKAIEDLLALISDHQPGATVSWAVLSPSNPEFS